MRGLCAGPVNGSRQGFNGYWRAFGRKCSGQSLLIFVLPWRRRNYWTKGGRAKGEGNKGTKGRTGWSAVRCGGIAGGNTEMLDLNAVTPGAVFGEGERAGRAAESMWLWWCRHFEAAERQFVGIVNSNNDCDEGRDQEVQLQSQQRMARDASCASHLRV
ncbi:hypothetical protein BU24DRAFT_453837 [Aaosphaeria arxii CBS 175.79]|uniref:Uncharacterized protein n=1 Tax=Aaosphaeria arxii CBS 175.79 TaxID=1450172 RepID=A0A6A5XE06_9PLEO|nr:uncharacterized protein BU24DRAFT_453837 [Aaosphaeria arxii CBS 175.79]KAF2011248.1 hypothetical protein BU24DRAFT_453837 [Aaosphaeria arxii CBS 175.79]